MSHSALSKQRAQLQNFTCNLNKALARPASPNFSTPRFLVLLAAGLLMIASTGFAGAFGWLLGSQYGPLLGCFMVLMAIGIELAKPFCVAGAITALREWKILQAVALGAAGLMAIAFSATAELSLNAMMRSDFVAERASGAGAASKAAARYRRAETDLASLTQARPVEELEAEVNGLLLLPGVNNCVTIDGPVTSKTCPRVAELRAELARAQRRVTLIADMRDAEAAQNSVPAVTYADPGAAALAAYSDALGVPVPADKLSLWLPLIAVLALQLGAATSVLLVQSVGHPATQDAEDVSQRRAEGSQTASGRKAVKPRRDDRDPPGDGTLPKDRRGLMSLIRGCTNGTAISVRKLARETGQSKSAVHRMLHRLAEAGEIVLETSAAGTILAAAA